MTIDFLTDSRNYDPTAPASVSGGHDAAIEITLQAGRIVLEPLLYGRQGGWTNDRH